MKINFYGYIQDSNLIKKTIQNIYSDNTLFEGSTPVNDTVGTRITTDIIPSSATPLDNYSYVQEFDDIFASE